MIIMSYEYYNIGNSLTKFVVAFISNLTKESLNKICKFE